MTCTVIYARDGWFGSNVGQIGVNLTHFGSKPTMLGLCLQHTTGNRQSDVTDWSTSGDLQNVRRQTVRPLRGQCLYYHGQYSVCAIPYSQTQVRQLVCSVFSICLHVFPQLATSFNLMPSNFAYYDSPCNYLKAYFQILEKIFLMSDCHFSILP